ncbi:MAG: hypothetical protein Q8O13_09910 [Candidatus Omnitrophota bacterium]|nr:hypothetical protein [Candidatus Omnitrophota bacterium]
MNKFIGLEVNSQAITLAYLAVIGKRWILLKSGSVKIEKEEANTQKTVSALKDLLKDVDLMDTKVISTINHQHLFVRELIFPQMSNKELLEAIRWKVKDYLTFPLEEAVIDVKITVIFPRKSGHKEELVVV